MDESKANLWKILYSARTCLFNDVPHDCDIFVPVPLNLEAIRKKNYFCIELPLRIFVKYLKDNFSIKKTFKVKDLMTCYIGGLYYDVKITSINSK